MTPEIAKSTSHKFLRDHGIPINEHLPLLESRAALKPQNADAVALCGVELTLLASRMEQTSQN